MAAVILLNVLWVLVWADFNTLWSEAAKLTYISHCGTPHLSNEFCMYCCLAASVPVLLWAFCCYRSNHKAMTPVFRVISRTPLTILLALNCAYPIVFALMRLV